MPLLEKLKKIKTPKFLKPIAGELLFKREPEYRKPIEPPITEGVIKLKPPVIKGAIKLKPISIKPLKPIVPIKPTVREEIPEAAKTVFGAIGRFTKTVQEEIARSGASVGMTLTGYLTGKRELDISGPEIENKVARVIFGDRPLKSIETRIAEGELALKDFAGKLGRKEVDLPLASRELEKSFAKFSEENALAMSVLGVGLIIGLDFTGAGGTKNAVRIIAKSKSPEFIAKILKQINVADDLIPSVSKKLAGITNEKEVLKAINKIDEIQKTTKAIKEGTLKAVEVPKIKIPEIKPLKRIVPKIPEVKPVIKPIKPTPEQVKFLSKMKKQIQKGISRKTATIKEADLRKVRMIKERAMVKGRIEKVEIRGEAKLARETEMARIVSEKTIRKQELKMLRGGIELRTAKDKIIKRIITKTENIQSIKKDIYQFTKEKLPIEKRGKLLASVARAETRSDISHAFRMIVNERNKIIRKELTTNLEEIVKDIEKLPLKWQDRIMAEMDKIAFKGITEKTITKLTKLRDFLVKQPEAELLFGRKTLKEAKLIERLGKQNIADMDLRDLIKLNAKVSKLSEWGKLAQKTITETKQLQQEALLKKLQITSKNIDVGIPRTIAVKLTTKEKLTNTKYQIAEQMQNGYMNYISTDIGFEILDNNVRLGLNMRTFKLPFDDAFLGYKEMNSGIVDDYFDFKKGLEKQYKMKFENHNMERIMIYATSIQKGGKEKLIKSGVNELLPKGITIDDIILDKPETELYQFMRNVFDELYPHIDGTLQSAHNRRLGKVDDYFSWQTDFNNSDEVFKRLENDYILTSRTQAGFTKERTLAGKQVLKMDAEKVFLKHTNDATYFIHTEGLLNDLGKTARTNEYLNAVGSNGRKWVAGWIDLMARKGIPEGYRPTWVTPLLNNVGAGILGFRISPVVKQPIAKITSATLLGRHTFLYDPQFFKHNLSPYVKNISRQQKFRTFDDPAYTELAKNKKLAKWQEYGYQGIKHVDGYTADSVWYASYRKYFADHKIPFSLDDFKNGISNKGALEYADLITRRTQGSGEAKDLARMLVGKNREIFRSILKFQTFILNESYLIPHDAIGVAIKTEKDYGKAIGIIMAYMISGISEDYIATGISQLFSPAQYAEKEREKKFVNRIFDAMISKIPFVNNAYGIYKYDSTGTVITDLPKNAISGGKSLIQGKKPETQIKGLSRLIETIGQSIGIAGIGQFGQIFRKYIIKPEKKKITPTGLPSLPALPALPKLPALP